MASQQVEQIQEAKPKDVDAKEQKRFTQHLIHDCTLACNDFQSKDFDLEKAKKITAEKLTAIGTMEGLKWVGCSIAPQAPCDTMSPNRAAVL